MHFSVRFALAMTVLGAALGGCATSSPADAELAKTDSAVVEAPFPQTWQSVKAVLRERDYLIYTRDKRGLFIAFTDAKRRRLVPHRTQFTVTLEEVSAGSTRVSVETTFQQYGVSLTTYPMWHSKAPKDTAEALALLEAIQAKATGAAPAPPVQEAAPTGT